MLLRMRLCWTARRDRDRSRPALLSRLSRCGCTTGAALGSARHSLARTAVHAKNAEDGKAFLRAHDECRSAWLGVGRFRLSLSADASGNRRAMAKDAGGRAGGMGQIVRLAETAGGVPRQLVRYERAHRAASGSCRCRSAIVACFATAGCRAATPHVPSSSIPAMRWRSAAPRG